MLTPTYLVWSSDQKEGIWCEFVICDGFRMLWVHRYVICYRLLMLLLDATSSHTSFGIGKDVALRKLSSNANFTITAKVFSNDASLDDIVLAGEMALCCLYGSSSSEGLDAVRYRHFTEKVTRRTTNVHLHIVSLQQPLLPFITVHACISKFQCGSLDGEVEQIGPRKMRMAPNTGRHEPRTTDLPPARSTGWSVPLQAANSN